MLKACALISNYLGCCILIPLTIKIPIQTDKIYKHVQWLLAPVGVNNKCYHKLQYNRGVEQLKSQ